MINNVLFMLAVIAPAVFRGGRRGAQQQRSLCIHNTHARFAVVVGGCLYIVYCVYFTPCATVRHIIIGDRNSEIIHFLCDATRRKRTSFRPTTSVATAIDDIVS